MCVFLCVCVYVWVCACVCVCVCVVFMLVKFLENDLKQENVRRQSDMSEHFIWPFVFWTKNKVLSCLLWLEYFLQSWLPPLAANRRDIVVRIEKMSFPFKLRKLVLLLRSQWLSLTDSRKPFRNGHRRFEYSMLLIRMWKKLSHRLSCKTLISQIICWASRMPSPWKETMLGKLGLFSSTWTMFCSSLALLFM